MSVRADHLGLPYLGPALVGFTVLHPIVYLFPAFSFATLSAFKPLSRFRTTLISRIVSFCFALHQRFLFVPLTRNVFQLVRFGVAPR